MCSEARRSPLQLLIRPPTPRLPRIPERSQQNRWQDKCALCLHSSQCRALPCADLPVALLPPESARAVTTTRANTASLILYWQPCAFCVLVHRGRQGLRAVSAMLRCRAPPPARSMLVVAVCIGRCETGEAGPSRSMASLCTLCWPRLVGYVTQVSEPNREPLREPTGNSWSAPRSSFLRRNLAESRRVPTATRSFELALGWLNRGCQSVPASVRKRYPGALQLLHKSIRRQSAGQTPLPFS